MQQLKVLPFIKKQKQVLHSNLNNDLVQQEIHFEM